MKYRLFIAINLPEEIKRELQKYRDKWPELPGRWVGGNNLHLTLVFIGYATDEGLLEVCRATKEVSQKRQPFSIKLNRICYGPPPHPAARVRLGGAGQAPVVRDDVPYKLPRMIWVMGEAVEEFITLKSDLETALTGSNQIRFIPEKREPKIHITLARIRQWDFRSIEPEERPEIDEEVNFTIPVETIEVMESKLKRGGAEYSILESFPLGEL